MPYERAENPRLAQTLLRSGSLAGVESQGGKGTQSALLPVCHILNTYLMIFATKSLADCEGDCGAASLCSLFRHVGASLDLSTRKSPRSWRDLSEKRALSARRLFL